MAIYDLGHRRFNPFLTGWTDAPQLMSWFSWQKGLPPR
jgi:hypothetical protein